MRRSLWHKARERRPSIFAPKRKPLLERYGLLGNQDNWSPEQFERFLMDFLRRKRGTTDIFEKHAQVAKALENSGDSGWYWVSTQGGRLSGPLGLILGFAIFLQDHLQTEEQLEPEVINNVIRAAISNPWGFVKNQLQGYSQLSFRKLYGETPMVMKEQWAPEEVRGFECGSRRLFRKAVSLVRTDTGIPRRRLKRLMISNPPRFRYGAATFEYLPFTHLIPSSRLYAVFGETYGTSYTVNEPGTTIFTMLNLESGQSCYLRDIEEGFTGNHSALIFMYPWEADHTEKAVEMAARGIPVAKSRGKVLLGEYEFAVFQWVKGTPLNRFVDTDVWGEYGRIVGDCHERGIVLDDAAGRNAIGRNGRVTLIDFEHTRLRKEPKPVGMKPRRGALERIEGELEGCPELMSAFLKGYESP